MSVNTSDSDFLFRESFDSPLSSKTLSPTALSDSSSEPKRSSPIPCPKVSSARGKVDVLLPHERGRNSKQATEQYLAFLEKKFSVQEKSSSSPEPLSPEPVIQVPKDSKHLPAGQYEDCYLPFAMDL